MNLLKKITAAAMALTFVFALTACGDTYAKDLQAALAEIDANNQASLTVDWTDETAVQSYVDTNKATYQKILDMKPSSKFADAHAKLSEGAQGMIDYLDALPGFCKMDQAGDEYNNKRTELMNVYTTALGKIAEGTAALNLDGGDAASSSASTSAASSSAAASTSAAA